MNNLLFPELNNKTKNTALFKGNILFPDLKKSLVEEVPEWGQKNLNIWAGMQAVKETGKEVGKAIAAVPETALSLATGMIAYPIGALGELGALAFTDAETAKELRQYLGETFTYQPKGKTARETVEAAGEILAIPFKPAEKYKEIVTEKYGTWWGELAGLGAEALTMGLMSYAHTSVNKLMPEKLPLPSKEIKAFDWEKYSTELRKELEKTEDPVKKIETARKFVDDLNESFGIGQKAKSAKESAERIEGEFKKEVFREQIEKLTEVSGKSAEDSAAEFIKSLGLEPSEAREIPVEVKKPQKVPVEIMPEEGFEIGKTEHIISPENISGKNIKVFHQSNTGNLKLGQDIYGLGEGYFVSKTKLPKDFYGKKDIALELKPETKLFDFQQWAKENNKKLRVSLASRSKIIQEAVAIAKKDGYDGIEIMPDDIWIFNKNSFIDIGPTTKIVSNISQTKKPSTLIQWVRNEGGIWDESLKGEMESFAKQESGIVGLIAKKGKAFDELAARAVEDKWLPEGSAGIEFRALLENDINAIKTKKDRVKPFGQETFKPSRKRSIKEVASDINTALGKKGEVGGKLTPEQEAARQRLSQDIDYLKDQAKQSGKSLYDYLILEGVQPEIAKSLAGDLPKYAGSINLQKQKIPDNYKAFELELSQQRPKKVQTWDQTGKLSAEILADYKKSVKVLEKVKKGHALTAVEIDAIRQVNVNAIDRLKEIAKSGTEEQFAESFTNYKNDIFALTSDASSEAGRALNIHKREVSVNRLSNAFNELKRGLNEREFKEFKELNFENPLEVERFIARLGDPKLMDYIYEYWYNSILSGIPTHGVNMISNTIWGLFQIPHRGLVAGIDSMISKLPGRQREYFFRELLPMMAGEGKGFPKGASGAWEMIKTGKARGYESKWNRDIGQATASAFERSPHKALREAAPYISMPFRALQAMDVWANSMAFDAQLGALAKRRALQKFPKDAVKAQVLEKALLKNPTKEMLDDSVQFARYATFNDDPGVFANWIIRGRDIVPAGRFVLPFVRTVGNIFKRGAEMTPGVGLLLKKGQHPSEIIAKQIEGSILTLYALYKVEQGEITGSAPTEPAKKEAFYRQGKIPWGIRIGKNWYQYRRFEPFNTSMALATIAYDSITNAKDDKTATEIFSKTVDGMVDNLVESSYLDGVSKLLNKQGNRARMPEQILASFVPYSGFWRSINRAIETLTEEDETAKVREMKGITRALSQVIPTLSSIMPAKINVWGKEISIPGGIIRQWLPYKYSEATTDPVELELENLKITPGLPRQEVTIRKQKVKLPDDIYRNYAILLGSEMKNRLNQIMLNEQYQVLPDERKVLYLDKQMTKIRQRVLRRAKIEYLKSKNQSIENITEEEE